MIRSRVYATLAALLLASAGSLRAQVTPGRNISIVSSDPVNQKQLEVDAAANPRNPNHLFAGYITYVSATENPNRATSTGRCGYSFSTNGGKTWTNALLPEVPNMDKCGDPAVTWDTNGHAYFLGLYELRDGATTGMVVWRLTDPDDGSGRMILDAQVEIDRGTASDGQVVDKSAIAFQPSAVADPNAPGTVYACYSIFDGSNSSKVVCAISRDGGLSYAKPVKYNKTINSNNGTAMAAGPNESVYLFWRAFDGAENGYYFVRVNPNGTSTSPVRVPLGSTGFYPYDAPTRPDLARSNGFPAVASDGNRRLLLTFQAFADAAGLMAPSGPATSPKIFGVYSSDGGTTWTTPFVIDPGPHNYTHQFMPRATFAGGIWSVVFYDARNDGCVEAEPRTCAGRPLVFDAATGRYFPKGRDRRFDLRVTQSGDPTQFPPSTQVTLYETRPAPGAQAGTPERIVQRDQRCAPNCPAFNTPFLPVGAGGTTSWMGDYIAHAARTLYLRNAPGVVPAWRYTGTRPGDPTGTVAFWADFRKVGFPLVVSSTGLVPDMNGDWTGFVPGSLTGVNACTNPTSRDVDVMFSEITNGGLAAAVKSTAQRQGVPAEFTVSVQNFTGRDVTLRLRIADGAPSEDWSMAQTLAPPAVVVADDNVVDVKVLRNSSVTKPIFYRWRSSSAAAPVAPVTIRIDEIAAPGAPNLLAGGVSTTVSYVPATAGPLSTGSPYGVTALAPVVSTSAFRYKGQPSNQLIENQLIENQLIENQLIENQLIENQLIENQLIENSLVEDQQILWTMTGAGALTTAVTAFSNLPNGQELLQSGWQFQFLVYQTQLNPRVAGCQQVNIPTDVLLSNIAITRPNQLIENQLVQNFQVSNQLIENQLIENQLIENSPISEQVSNATFALDPSERVTVALRAYRPTSGPGSLLTLPTAEIGQAAFSQARDTDPVTGAPIDIGTFYDTTPPVLTPQVSGTAGSNGWYRSAVSVSWVVTDAQSGIASRDGCDPVTLTAETAGTTLRCSATNRGGLTNSSSVTVKIDLQAPIVTVVVTPAPAPTGWYNASTGAPTIAFACQDASSGVVACPAPVRANEGRNQTFSSGAVFDLAGNRADPVVVTGINVDTVVPTISLVTPVNGATYLLRSVVNAAYTCADSSGSGIAGCVGTVPNGNAVPTGVVGSASFTVRATDVAGNASSAVSAYTVAYLFLLTPPKSPSTLGNAVPLTWQLKDANGLTIADLATLTTLSATFGPKSAAGCAATTSGPTVTLYSPATGASGGSDFRFIQSSGSYRFNWDTKTVSATGAGCYTLVWRLNDATTQRAVVELR